MTQDREKREAISLVLQSLGLTIESTFVPFSQSRNKDEKMPNLNWRISVRKDDREILSTDYSAGCASAPSYRQSIGRTNENRDRELRVAWECQHGFPSLGIEWRGRDAHIYGPTMNPAKAIKPDPLDVFYSLSMDSDVLDAGGFESWARDFGYDTDSRKAEKTYQACLDIALKLRAAIGDDGLTQLREAYQDY